MSGSLTQGVCTIRYLLESKRSRVRYSLSFNISFFYSVPLSRSCVRGKIKIEQQLLETNKRSCSRFPGNDVSNGADALWILRIKLLLTLLKAHHDDLY